MKILMKVKTSDYTSLKRAKEHHKQYTRKIFIWKFVNLKNQKQWNITPLI